MSTDGITKRLRDDLEVAAQTLRRYEALQALHRAKGTLESVAKAEANAVLAERFEATLQAFDRAILQPEMTFSRAEVTAMINAIDRSAASFGLELFFPIAPGLPNVELRKAKPVTVLEAVLRANPLAMPDMRALEHVIPPRFLETSCSQCGQAFGPGEHGFSHCQDHEDKGGSA